MKNSVSADLFGVLQPKEATGGHIPDVEALRHARDADDGCAIVGFCSGCGMTTNFSSDGVGGIAKQLGQDPPASPEDYYVLMDGCLHCTAPVTSVSFEQLEKPA